MRIPAKKTVLITAAVTLLVIVSGTAHGYLKLLPPLGSPDEYGNFLISRASVSAGVKPAAFSHWIHRMKHTCRVCHFELEFNMRVNTTQITEAANKAGKFCGAGGCHDGKAAFSHDKANCEKCHTGNRRTGSEKFGKLPTLPPAQYGNRISWEDAMEKGDVKPVRYLNIAPPNDIGTVNPFRIAAVWNSIPPPIFSHKKHTDWLDCNNCHPDIFDLRKKEVKKYDMVGMIVKREYCCVCHLTVAFPMNDCLRCHPYQRKK